VLDALGELLEALGVVAHDATILVGHSERPPKRGYRDAMIRVLEPADGPACDDIVAGLPEWFGLEEGRRECAAAVRSESGLVAWVDDAVLGFLTYQRLFPVTAEITWMAVRADRRRGGLGHALIDELVSRERSAGLRFLAVKTLSARDPDPNYAETRAFYGSVGFLPVQEFEPWGPENPAVLMIKPL